MFPILKPTYFKLIMFVFKKYGLLVVLSYSYI